MKKFNLVKTLLAGTFAVLFVVCINSCKKDKDPDRKAFLGTYSISSGTITCSVTGNSTLTPGTAVIITENSGGDEKISISIAGQVSITGTVSGKTVTIDNQTLGGYTYTGTGSINGNTFTLALNEQDPSVPETCVYNFSATK